MCIRDRAYGDETVTLANFDRIIPDKVFQEVTSITLEQSQPKDLSAAEIDVRIGATWIDPEVGAV